jgi:hypothetical protein
MFVGLLVCLCDVLFFFCFWNTAFRQYGMATPSDSGATVTTDVSKGRPVRTTMRRKRDDLQRSTPHLSTSTVPPSRDDSKQKITSAPSSAPPSSAPPPSSSPLSPSTVTITERKTRAAVHVARRPRDSADETKRLSFALGVVTQHLGETVRDEIEELAAWPLFSTSEKRNAIMRQILAWETEEPLRVGYWRLSADPNVMDAAETRQWQTLIRTYLRRLSDEQLHAKIAKTPALLAQLIYKPAKSSLDTGSDESDRRKLLALSLPNLLGMVLQAGELDVRVRAYFLEDRPDIRRSAYAPPARPSPLPTIDAYIDDAIRQNVVPPRDVSERQAVVSYLKELDITTPRRLAALPSSSPILGKMSLCLIGECKAGHDMWSRIRYTLKLPLSSLQLVRYHRSYVLDAEQKRTRVAELVCWEETFRDSLSRGDPVNLRIEFEDGRIRHTKSREYIPYRPLTPMDPVVDTQRKGKSSVIVRGRIVDYRGTTNAGGTIGIGTEDTEEASLQNRDVKVTIEIDTNQFPWLDGHVVSAQDRTFVATPSPQSTDPWLDGHVVSAQDRTFVATPSPQSTDLQWYVDWTGDNDDIKTEEETYARMFRLLGSRPDNVSRRYPAISDVCASIQPPVDMIRRLTLALAQVGERLEVQRTPLLVGASANTSTIEGRILGGTRDGDAVWVWADGHVVEFSSPHLNPRAIHHANIGDLVGTRRESPLTPSMYDIRYTTPLIGTTAARIDLMRRSVPYSLQQVPGLINIVASMLE